MSDLNLDIFVFSYNRGQFLDNCLKTIEASNAKGFSVIVIDDNSDEPKTLSVLEEAKSRYNIELFRNTSEDKEFKTGGLCGSMNLAMRIAQERKMAFALFIQDDMQFLRQIKEKDLENFKSYFSSNPASMQLSLCFFPLRDHSQRGREMVLDVSGVAWTRLNEYEAGKSYFSDVGLFHVERFFEFLGHFEPGEEINSRRCSSAGLYRGLYRAPMMHWLPFPTSFRGGKRSFSHGLVESICGAGFHPYIFFEPDDQEPKLKSWSDPSILTEKALYSLSAPKSEYWSVTGGVSQIFARGGWRLFVFRLLQSIRIQFLKVRS